MKGNLRILRNTSKQFEGISFVFSALLIILCMHFMYSEIYPVKVKFPQSRRPISCRGCFEFVLSGKQNTDICSGLTAKKDTHILILIFTVHSNTMARKILRQTWLSSTLNNTSHIRYAFLVGTTYNDTLNNQLQEENEIHNDIIQFDFIDSYRNLTLKTMFGFKWVSTFCTNANFVLKTDDDVYLNLQGLRVAVYRHKGVLKHSVGGYCNLNSKRDDNPASKWYVSSIEYPNDYYPALCNGIGYVTSMEVISDILMVSRNIPYFHLEDVYVGFCIHMLGYEFVNIFGFFQETFVSHTPCNFKNRNFVLCHSVHLKTVQEIWGTPCKKKLNMFKSTDI